MSRKVSGKLIAAANQMTKERDYWLKELAGDWTQCHFPYDFKPDYQRIGSLHREIVQLDLNQELTAKLLKLSNGSDARLYMVLLAGVVTLLEKYTDQKDILLGVPIQRQATEGDFLNTVFAVRNRLEEEITFKELIIQVKDQLLQAVQHQNYPIEVLIDELGLSVEEGFPLFDLVVLLENIHDPSYVQHVDPNMIFHFHRREEILTLKLEFNSRLYEQATIFKIVAHLETLLREALDNLDLPRTRLEILDDVERHQLLVEFNDTRVDYALTKTIHQLFEEQVEITPEKVAVVFAGEELTYGELNGQANRLARVLRKHGVEQESVVGVIFQPSFEMIVTILAILKAGGAYLPLDPALPVERIQYMLDDAGANIIVSHDQVLQHFSYTKLQNFTSHESIKIVTSAGRSHIQEFNDLPIPDRSWIDVRKYQDQIGMASVTNCISIQSTRGCPYKCLYCHKVWSKNHVYRSAERIYQEIAYYYHQGVTNFSFIDDCFNLNVENSTRLFQLMIKNKLKINIFFPNGLRGDLLTPDYIDLMVEAGTCNINLSLETASPRLQKLIKKNLDLDKFRDAITYIAEKHPKVILEIATMHGFPTETEEEALMTLDFIKDIQWIHFPYIHILKIFPNTEMEELALAHGVSREDLQRSTNLAYHELPETLPFAKSFTRKYQASFMNDYFLSKERLRQVLPIQMQVLSPEAMIQKYNSYLPFKINHIEELLQFAQIEDLELPDAVGPTQERPIIFQQEQVMRKSEPGAKKILLLDLSQHFSSYDMLYNVTEQPLGLIYLLTYLKERFGHQIDGRIYKSGVDFDSFLELKELVDTYQPDLIGIRSLTYYKEFFHETVALLRQWGIDVPIVAGGPYATSDYDSILKDQNVNLAVLGEGEYTLTELVQTMFQNEFQLPTTEELRQIPGLAYVEKGGESVQSRMILNLDRLQGVLAREDSTNLNLPVPAEGLAYVMYTSGSTGKPKGVMVEHRQVNNCIYWMQDTFQLETGHTVVLRTNLTFDPSVWEIFWPLYLGATVRVLTTYQSKDAAYLVELMQTSSLNLMYCPATLVTAMIYILRTMPPETRLTMPWLLIGAEPINMETVKEFYQYYDGKIVNTYGPTECTINNTYYFLEPDDPGEIVPIGKPIANNQIYIVSKQMELLPVNVVGEICIAGESLARGYIHNPEKTDAAFVDHPFGTGKLYKTGDLGRWLPDGNIQIMGRVDEQVKVRGYRIELGEIESAIVSHAAVNECVVLFKDLNEESGEQKVCKQCGITTDYPGVKISEDQICETCQNLSSYREVIDPYFTTLDDLAVKMDEVNINSSSPYDCLLLYSGGRGSAYALYQLVDRGFRVLAATYDHGYYAGSDLSNIQKTLSKLGVDHVILQHDKTDLILQESLRTAHTLCRGCFNISSSLAGEYAYHHQIKIVVGATLSRGQIIENKLNIFLQQGMRDLPMIEKEIGKLQRNTPMMNRTTFDYLDLDMYRDGSVYDTVTFLDFYRYCDITNEEMIRYLNERDPYWISRKDYAIYSTNCPLKQVSDYDHLQAKGYHYYGSATSWEKRLGHLSLENLKADLRCTVTEQGYRNALHLFGVEPPKQEEKESKALCCYLVSDQEIDFAKIREHLAAQLPSYMIPAYGMQLDRLPLTINGKIDKKKLPKPEVFSSAEYVMPTTEAESGLVQIWQEILETGRVGITDNFFEMGGDSIRAMKVNNRISEEFGISIGLEKIFTKATIEELAKVIEETLTSKGQNGQQIPQIVKAPQAEYYDLAPVQLPEWYMHELEPESSFYNISNQLLITGGLDVTVFHQVWQTLVERHSILRTYFSVVEDRPVQSVYPELNLALEDVYLDYTHLSQDEEEEMLRELAYQHANIIFDFSKGPLFDVKLVGLSGDRYYFMFVVHHIIWDETSSMNLEREFTELYIAYKMGQTPALPTLKYDYVDYAHWMNQMVRDGAIAEQRQYWLNQFATVPQPLDLPTDFPRPTIQTFNGALVAKTMEADYKARLNQYCAENQLTLFVLLLATFHLQLHRLSGQDDIVVGTPFANRDLVDLEPMMGLFACALLLRSTITGKMTGRDLLKATQKVVIDAYDHHLYPSNLIIEEINPEKDFSRSRMFSVMFGLMNKKQDDESRAHLGLEFDFGRGQINHETSHFDLTLAADETGAGITFTLNYNTDLYSSITAQRMLENYLVLLQDLIQNPEKRMSEYQIVTPEEVSLMVEQWNQTDQQYSDQCCIHHLIEKRAETQPDRVAIHYQGQDVSYGELNRKANQLAHYLRKLGVEPEEKVAVMLDPSPELLIAVLGILKAGAAYVPISPEYPHDRKKYIMTKANIKVVLSDLFGDRETLQMMPEENLHLHLQPDNVAYVIFTSGTTGRPKGIEIEHRGVINVLEWMQREYPLTLADATLFHTSFTFDASVLEYLWPLCMGARVVIPFQTERTDPAMIGALAVQHQVTFLQFVPEMLDSFIDGYQRGEFAQPEGLRYVVCGASAMTRALRDKFYQFFDCKLANHYGPTETTIDAITFDCAQEFVGDDVPIGKPMGNTKVYILDHHQKPVPVGVVGEIYIASPGVARGYVDEPELTAGSFVLNPFSAAADARLYKTGDLGKYTLDGQIVFKGRVDKQVKIRGNRIEPEEIENRISIFPGISRVAVRAHEAENQEQFLVAYAEQNRQLNSLTDRNGETYWMYPLAHLPERKGEMDQIHIGSWPAYFEGAQVYLEFWQQIMVRFRPYQMGLYNREGQVVAVGNALPIYWDGTVEGLPEGWDHGVQQAFDPGGYQPNTLMVLAGVVGDQYQNQGLGSLILEGFKMLAKGHGLERVLVPVRPTGKADHPEMTFPQWCQERRDDGLLADNWLRIHERLGARILKMETRSQYITGSIQDWEQWSGRKFTESGEYDLKDTLQSVRINIEEGIGEYYDPCVWVEHPFFEDEVYEWTYFDGQAIQNHLKNYLPDYMIPTHYQFVQEIPLGHSGKTDYQQLPELGSIHLQVREFVSPRNGVEAELQKLWEEILNRESISVRDNFFEIGGHSLKATVMLSRMRRIFPVQVPVRLLLENPTIEGLAVIIEQKGVHNAS